jgi:hypothetical protein
MVNDNVSKGVELNTSTASTHQSIQMDGRIANHTKRPLCHEGVGDEVGVWHIGSKILNSMGMHKIVCIKEGDNVCSNDRQSLIPVLGLIASVLSCDDSDRERIVSIRRWNVVWRRGAANNNDIVWFDRLKLDRIEALPQEGDIGFMTGDNHSERGW